VADLKQSKREISGKMHPSPQANWLNQPLSAEKLDFTIWLLKLISLHIRFL
jgi:hypothetical protein